jgi:hypothetical protein
MFDIYDENEGWPGILNELFGALGRCQELEPGYARSDAEEAINTAIGLVEDSFCAFDRAAYKRWARDISDANGEVWEPCDGWYRGRRKKSELEWIDEESNAGVEP